MIHVHRPKIDLYDLAAMTNTDPKGVVRAVDHYRETGFGLYMARPLDGHPDIAYFRTWLLPAHGLKIGRWLPRPGGRLDHDVYIDLADVERGPVWRTVDLYLDVLVHDGTGLRVLDTDELLAARTAGHLDDTTAQRVLERVYGVVEGITAAGYDVERWLRSAFKIALTWDDAEPQ